MLNQEKLEKIIALLEEAIKDEQAPEVQPKKYEPTRMARYEATEDDYRNFKVDALTYLLHQHPQTLDDYYNRRLQVEKMFEDKDEPDPDYEVLRTDKSDPYSLDSCVWETPLPGASINRNRPTKFMGKGARGINDWNDEISNHRISEQINWHLSKIQKLINRKSKGKNDK